MTGLLSKKYHIAILDSDDDGFVTRVVDSLLMWYSNKVVIQTYRDTREMFEAVNLYRAKNKPFDIVFVKPEQMAERLVLQRANPLLKVLACKDAKTLKAAADKVLL